MACLVSMGDRMVITENTPIRDIAAAQPSSVRVFQHYQIDFCCGGERPIGEACREQGLAFDEVARAIEAAAARPAGADRDWTREPLSALIDYIVAVYHLPLRDELPRLQSMAEQVRRVHGDHAPYLARIEEIVAELAAELSVHMGKEEVVLFPAVRAIENGEALAPTWITAPIAVMEHEHDHAGALLAELRRLAHDYLPPDWACQTFRALYQGLAQLEAEMHVHVHLENNILFPRALEEAQALVVAKAR